MPETQSTAPAPTEAELEERRGIIDGLRELADALEANPEMPHPWTAITIFAAHVKREGESELEVMARAARAIPGMVEKETLGDAYFQLSRKFGSLPYELIASREEVCVRRQVGERKVTRVVPASTETKEVEDTEPIYEWDCKPVLRLADDEEKAA